MATSNIISRSNVIAGAVAYPDQPQPSADIEPLPEGGEKTRDLTAVAVKTATVVLAAAGMQAINSSPPELVAAPDDGSSIQVTSIRVQKAANAYGGNRVLAFRYGVEGANVAQVPAATITGAGETEAYADPVAPTTPIPLADTALHAFAVGDYAGDGGDVTITVKYVLVKDNA